MKLKRACRGFSLLELFVVVAILGVLAALSFPAFFSATEKSRISEASHNLRQVGLAFQAYAAENHGFLPSVRGSDNNSAAWRSNGVGWWMTDLTPFLGGPAEPELYEVSESLRDPHYWSKVGGNDKAWRTGFGMNSRMGLSIGDQAGTWASDSTMLKRSKLARYRATTILVGPSYFEHFSPKWNGLVDSTQRSDRDMSSVEHTRRIHNKSALYLLVDGSVKNLSPNEAADLLRLQ